MDEVSDPIVRHKLDNKLREQQATEYLHAKKMVASFTN